MASLADIQDAAATQIKALVPGLATCEAYAGQFSPGDEKRLMFRAPAVFVAVLGGKAEDPGTEQIDLELRLIAYVVWRGGRGRTARADGAAALAEAVMLEIERNQWGLSGLGPAKIDKVENLYSAALDKRGMALWAITWIQVLRVGTSIWTATGVTPVDVFAGYDPDVGAGHGPDYEDVTDAV